MPTVTVLAIDGGGIRGMIPAAFLNRLEQQTGHPVSELFDYVAGTSTGGILALGLGLRRPNQAKPYTAAELVSLYIAQGQHIFSRNFFHIVGALGNLNGPKYPHDGVDDVLKTYFAGMRLRDARTNVLVPAYAIELRCPFFFRSWQAQAKATAITHDFEAWQVARSTSAAPTFFPPHRAQAADGQTYALIDGGMYANNPALCAGWRRTIVIPTRRSWWSPWGRGTRASPSGTTTRRTGALPGGHLTLSTSFSMVSAIRSTLSSMRCSTPAAAVATSASRPI